jgi:hypothetical protein
VKELSVGNSSETDVCSVQKNKIMISPPSLDHPLSRQDRFRFPHNLWEVLRTARAGTRRMAAIAFATAWLPVILLAALHGAASLKSFLFDFAAQSRLFVVIPLLVFTEPLLIARLDAVARHFVDADLVKKEDLFRFEEAFTALGRRGNLLATRIVAVLMIYSFVAYAMPYLKMAVLPVWCYRTDAGGELSSAGSWYVLISLPLMLYLLLRWVWRQLLWSWFLVSVSRLDLQLISAHPDLMGGLGFVETYLRGYLPFGFAIGVIVAGGVANRMVHLHLPLFAFRYEPVIVVAFVLALCVAPLSAFLDLLLRTRRRGIFDYGSLAASLGHQFEDKWLVPDHKLDVSILEVPDFSATIDLYSVVSNVRQIRIFPVGVQSLSQLVVATLLPAIPIALFSVPFDVLLKGAMKFLL